MNADESDKLRFKEYKKAGQDGFWPDIQDPQDKELLQAAEDGDWKQITNLLTAGVHVDKILACRLFGDITVLVAASIYGQLECVQKLVELGAGLNKNDRYMTIYQSALIHAALGEHLQCFHFLTEARLFRGVSNACMYDDLITASKRGDFNQVLRLLEDVDEDLHHGWKGNNLMSLFMMYGCPPSCIQALIDLRVDINGHDFNGFTPLIFAVLSENIECIQLLLSLDVNIKRFLSVNDTSYFYEDGNIDPNISVKDKLHGLTAFMFAACLRNVQCLQAMAPFHSSNVDVDMCNELEQSPIVCAAYFGRTESVSLLIKLGASIYHDIYCANRFGDVFSYAILSKNYDCLEILLKGVTNSVSALDTHLRNGKKFSNINCVQAFLKSYDNMDVLNLLFMSAAQHLFVDSVCLLLDNGVDVNFSNIHMDKINPLMMSCSKGSLEMVKVLIEHGADIDAQDRQGNTPLIYAARNNEVKCSQQLLELGANIDIRNCEKQTAFLVSCINGHDEIANMFIAQEVNVNDQSLGRKSALILAACKNQWKCVELLMDHGADIDFRDSFGKTALILAGERGHVKVVELLLMKGANVNAQDDEGWTAAMYAALQNHVECLQQLMCANADLDILNKDSGSVFLASMFGDGSCMEMLLQSGKLFCDGVLKSVHNCAISNSVTKPGVAFKFTMRQILLTTQFRIFEWDYCHDSYTLPLFAFAAVQSGICPGKFKCDNMEASPLLLAIRKKDTATITYLLANLYFFPEDYRLLSTGQVMKNRIKILEKLTLKPLSLQAWSFLTVSKAVSLGGHPTERSYRVDSLPLPEEMKNKLKFQSKISKVCYSQWKCLRDHDFESLHFKKRTVLITEAANNFCAGWCCSYCVRFEL